MADADDSYDLLDIPKFVERLREGCELVQGCRLPAGGGRVRAGRDAPIASLDWQSRFLSADARWFHAPINDVYCGMRGFTRELYDRLEMRCPGMEFATEMILKAARRDSRMSEVPITLHPDGRKSHPPHLKTFRDGWRTLRFFLMFAPRWTFLEPGKLLVLLGLIGYAVALPGLHIAGVHFSAHTLLVATLFLLCGYQSIIFAIAVKTYAISQRLVPADDRLDKVFRVATLERVVITGVVMVVCRRIAADDRGQLLADGPFWRPELRADDALGCAGDGFGGAGRTDDVCGVLHRDPQLLPWLNRICAKHLQIVPHSR